MKWWNQLAGKRLVYITLGLTGVCIGLVIGRSVFVAMPLVLLLFSVILVIGRKQSIAYCVASLLVGLLLGNVRGHVFSNSIARYDALYGTSVTVRGPVVDDPGYNDRKMIEFHIGEPIINNTQLPGKVRIRTLRAGTISRGDIVVASGSLRETLGTGRQGSIGFANVQVLEEDNSLVERIRTRFFSSVFSALPEPQASLGLGYLAGVRSTLPPEFAEALAIVGLTHIVAVSGYNLTIIVQFVKRFFERVSAYQTVFFSIVLIAGFLLVTGWSPSITRAALISVLSLAAWYFGRSFYPLVIILIGAAVTAFINPLYIWGDVGWYLSFLAFAGVLIIAPLVLLLFGKWGKNILLAVLAETLAAQLVTAPYIAYIFGRISVISPIANLLVIPFIPLAMLLVFVTGVVGMASPTLALWVAVPARILMSFTVWVVEALAKIPWAQSSLKLQLWQMTVIYTVLGAVTFLSWALYRARARRSHSEQIDWNLL
ncbi:ComEC/Rec2 family competence protein [Candidatus Saccharibacteria bacterium]|nr:ComEC/Rec2 family competence protein [Candidatus Saccharibacteria bacterium]